MVNPVLVHDVLEKSFREMEPEEYKQSLTLSLKQARNFIKDNDGEFTSSLTLQEATTYASYVRAFITAFKDLEKMSSTSQNLVAGHHARMIAWRQVLSTFRTLHGKPTLK